MKLYLFDDIDSLDYRLHLSELPEWRREKALRYRQELDRRLCVASYLLLREALKADYGITEPLLFMYNEYGKPYLADYPHIFFSLSHCRCGVACVVSACETGVDIQDICKFVDDVAQRVFCTAELEVLNSSQDKEREFARLWSRKEAYLKMLGTGISDNIKSIDATAIKSNVAFDFADYCVCVCGMKDEKTELCRLKIEGLRGEHNYAKR